MNEITNQNKYLKETISIKKDLEKTFILLAERLYNIFSQRVWEETYHSWDEFLMELGVDTPTASKLMAVYKKYVIENGVDLKQLASVRSWQSLYLVRSLVKDKETAVAMVEDSQVLSQQDMRRKVDKEECDRHNWFSVRICKNCGCREKIIEE